MHDQPTQPTERKTPRTDVYFGFWATKYVNGRTVFDHARALEIETQELAEALERIARIGATELRHHHPVFGFAPHEVGVIAEEALARHRAKQEVRS